MPKATKPRFLLAPEFPKFADLHTWTVSDISKLTIKGERCSICGEGYAPDDIRAWLEPGPTSNAKCRHSICGTCLQIEDGESIRQQISRRLRDVYLYGFRFVPGEYAESVSGMDGIVDTLTALREMHRDGIIISQRVARAVESMRKTSTPTSRPGRQFIEPPRMIAPWDLSAPGVDWSNAAMAAERRTAKKEPAHV